MPDVLMTMRPGGFEEAWARARRRRMLQVGVGGGTSLAVALVFFLAQGGVGTDVLQQSPATSGTGVVVASQSPAAEEPSPSPHAGQQLSAGVFGPEPSSPAPAESLDPVPGQRSYPVVRDSTVFDGDLGTCGTSDTHSAAQGWCTQFPGPFTARRDSTQTYGVLICRLPHFPAATLSFQGDEASFDVSSKSRQEWSSDRHPKDTTNASHPVNPGTCLRWTVRWDTRDHDGELLPTGTYTFEASIYTNDGLAGSGQASGAIFLTNTFTVTP